MTCICGLVDSGKVYIGADSAGVAGLGIEVRLDEKVFTNSGFVIGFTSSFRMGQLLRYSFTPPRRHPEEDLMKYMVTEFIDAVRTCFRSGGYLETHNGVESGGFFLVGVEGRLFKIESDYQVAECADGYTATGCGEEFALGALFATKDLPAIERLEFALKAAEKHSAGVCGPFVFQQT